MLREHSSFVPETTLVDKEKEAIKRQESLYAEAGLTPESITARTVKIGERLRAGGPPDQFGPEMVYLMSSDSLYSLSKAKVAGQKVLTVAGSGEFAQVFASLGARQVDAFDISPYACFLDELKWVAAKRLSFQDYRRFIRAKDLMDSKWDNSELRDAPVVDRGIYGTLRDSLTGQARAYFDQILEGDHAKDFEPLEHVNRHFHFRHSRSGEEGYTKVPHLKDEEAWRAFQDRITRQRTEVLCSDLENVQDFSGYDYCYISNIGYNRDEQMEIIRNMLRKGAKKIGFSMSPSEAILREEEYPVDNQGNPFFTYPPLNQLEADTWRRQAASLEARCPIDVYFGHDADWKGVPPPHGKGIRAKIVNIDYREDYSVYLEVTAEDNQDAIRLDNPYDNP